jgi:hypothetical protein
MDLSKGGSWPFGFNMAGDIAEETERRGDTSIKERDHVL